MKQLLIFTLSALILVACSKQMTSKVNASSQDNLDSSRLPIGEWDSSNLCYDGSQYHAFITFYGVQAGDSIVCGFTSHGGEINRQFLEVVSEYTDIKEYAFSFETNITGANAYVDVFHTQGSAKGQSNGFTSSQIFKDCDGNSRKTFLNKLKDRLVNN